MLVAYRRLGSGLSTVGALIWLLWPEPGWQFDPSAAFTFAGALLTWMFFELQGTERVQHPSDLRLAREFLVAYDQQPPAILRDQDMLANMPDDVISDLGRFYHGLTRPSCRFFNVVVERTFCDFKDSLRGFLDFSAYHGGVELVGGRGIFTMRTRDDFCMGTLGDLTSKNAELANELASAAWAHAQNLEAVLRENLPSAFVPPENGQPASR